MRSISPMPLPGTRAHSVRLSERMQTVVWEVPGPPGAPALVLLHGVTLTARLNWQGVLGELQGRYRVLLFDQRGHGAGVRAFPFRLEDCADDVASIAADLGIDTIVPVGYSMGGVVAQLLWRRHPALVSGLVLCSTATSLCDTPWTQSAALAMGGVVAATMLHPMARGLRADVVGGGLLDHDTDPMDRRFALAEMRKTSMRVALDAMHAVCQFDSAGWIGSVNVPAAVLITSRDRVVPPRRQRDLARALPRGMAFELAGGHDVFLGAPLRFAKALGATCDAVALPSGPTALRA